MITLLTLLALAGFVLIALVVGGGAIIALIPLLLDLAVIGGIVYLVYKFFVRKRTRSSEDENRGQ